MIRIRPLACMFVVLSLSACSGKNEPAGSSAGAKPSKQPREAKPVAMDLEGEPGTASPAPAPPPVPPPAPSDAKAPPELGRQFADPGWFRKGLFADATNAVPRRSEADAHGFFTSSILFDLPESQTVETCASTIEAAVEPDVPDLKREVLDDGRVQFKGNGEHYEMTAQCGAPKGALKAFVSYRWTSDPSGAGGADPGGPNR